MGNFFNTLADFFLVLLDSGGFLGRNRRHKAPRQGAGLSPRIETHMAITQVARAKSLAWTGAGAPTSPLSNIQSCAWRETNALAEFKLGTARVKTRYKGETDAYIRVETADLGKLSGFHEGQKLTNVVLTLEGAIDAGGVQEGSDVTFTLSHAVVVEVGELSHGNDASDPIVGSLLIHLDRHVGAVSDPTATTA